MIYVFKTRRKYNQYLNVREIFTLCYCNGAKIWMTSECVGAKPRPKSTTCWKMRVCFQPLKCHRRKVKNGWPQDKKNTVAFVKLVNQSPMETMGSPPHPSTGARKVCAQSLWSQTSLIPASFPCVLLWARSSSKIFFSAWWGRPTVILPSRKSKAQRGSVSGPWPYSR